MGCRAFYATHGTGSQRKCTAARGEGGKKFSVRGRSNKPAPLRGVVHYMSKTYSPGSPRSRSRWVSERSLCSRNPIGGSTEFRVRADTQILTLHLTYAGAVVGRALGFNVQTYLSLRSLLNSVHKYEIVYVIKAQHEN